mgnify:FL=1|tara:strand:+ start:877 stop:1245 length:369 start_codon:yes stop_codon:yes gene_type:complete
MPWLNFDFVGTAVATNVDDSETAIIQETGTTQINIPQNIRLTDLVIGATAGQQHQYSIWTSGRKQSSNLSAAQMNPASQGRFSVHGQNIVIASGTSLQLRGSQTSTAGAAEATTVTLEYVAA